MSKPLDRIEDYLARVRRHLYAVPAAQRDELLAEMRGHLHAMAEENERAGHDREKAVALALEQFGEPSRIGQDMARSWLLADRPVDVLKRMIWIWAWSVLFYIGTAMCIGFACGLFFFYQAWHGVNLATPGAATTLFFERLNAAITVATLTMAALGLLLGFLGRLPGTRRRGAA